MLERNTSGVFIYFRTEARRMKDKRRVQMLRLWDLVITVGFCSEPLDFFLALNFFNYVILTSVAGGRGFILETRVARIVEGFLNPRVLSPRKIFVIL